jgi:hypothetical protein
MGPLQERAPNAETSRARKAKKITHLQPDLGSQKAEGAKEQVSENPKPLQRETFVDDSFTL